MPLYWSSRKLPALADMPARQRVQILDIALENLTPPQKLFINLFKLGLLIPPFIVAARLGNAVSILILLATALLYPLLLRPLRHWLASPHLAQAIIAYRHRHGE